MPLTLNRLVHLKKSFSLIFSIFILLQPINLHAQIKIALAGLSHDHVHGVLQRYKKQEVSILGIAESNPELITRYKQQYGLADNLFYKDLSALLKVHKPDFVMAFNPISEHVNVVEVCAPLGVNVMVEKPLAINNKQAEKIASLARQNKIKVLTNYETTWYASNQFLYDKINNEGSIGEIRKMIVHDGHEGPKEIGVSKEFLAWLTDPEKNGAGALVDFGCYGANLMTWLMKGQRPLSVTAIVKRIKPEIYPKVDDEATIILEYPQATGIIEASWNWPFGIKDLEVFGKVGYLQAVNGRTVRMKESGDKPYSLLQLQDPAAPNQNYISYLTAVLQGEISAVNDLSSLQNNIIVVEILEAARLSAKEGKKIILSKQ